MVNPTLDVGFSGQLGHSAVIMGGILLRRREGGREGGASWTARALLDGVRSRELARPDKSCLIILP